jgi:hypothetical protein
MANRNTGGQTPVAKHSGKVGALMPLQICLASIIIR